MKTTRRFFVLFLSCQAIIFLLGTCTKGKEQAIDPDNFVSDTHPPNITAMRIAGIPDENIVINQKTRQLIVTLPKDLSITRSKVAFTLSPGAAWYDYKLDEISFCHGVLWKTGPFLLSGLPFSPEDVVIKEGKLLKIYRLVVKAEGEMAFANPNEIIETKAGYGESTSIPEQMVYNFLEADKEIFSKVIFTHKATGERFVGGVSNCQPSSKVSLGVGLSLLGEYTMQIEKNSGRRTTNSLKLIVKPGKAMLYVYPYTLTNTSSNVIMAGGEGLYEASNVEVELVHLRSGERYRLKPNYFDPKGLKTTLPLPVGLKAGNYSTRLYHPQAEGSTSRTTVKSNEAQPIISSLSWGEHWTENIWKDINNNPIVLKRGDLRKFEISPRRASSVQIILRAINSIEKIQFSAMIPKGYTTSLDPSLYSTFTIPLDTPPGRYVMTISYEDDKGVEHESEPLEHDIIVK